jgi:hypothetical protein
MKRIIFIIFVFACSLSIAKAEYVPEEMIVLPWGWENNQQLPYAFNDLDGFWGPFKQYVDNEENVYLAYPVEDFRKYDNSGKLVFKKNIRVDQMAVNDSQKVYFTKLEPDQNHIVRILDKEGKESEKSFQFLIDNRTENISWMKNRNGFIVFGNYQETAAINNNLVSSIERQKKNPVNSRGFYFQSETAVRKSNRTSKASYGKKYVNILVDKVVSNEIVIFDTLSLDICRYAHVCADVFQVDQKDNMYIRLYYDEELPVDIVVIDSAFEEIDRIELIPPAGLRGLGAKPFVRHDGTIYEFRDLDDGLHVIRWSSKE